MSLDIHTTMKRMRLDLSTVSYRDLKLFLANSGVPAKALSEAAYKERLLIVAACHNVNLAPLFGADTATDSIPSKQTLTSSDLLTLSSKQLLDTLREELPAKQDDGEAFELEDGHATPTSATQMKAEEAATEEVPLERRPADEGQGGDGGCELVAKDETTEPVEEAHKIDKVAGTTTTTNAIDVADMEAPEEGATTAELEAAIDRILSASTDQLLELQATGAAEMEAIVEATGAAEMEAEEDGTNEMSASETGQIEDTVSEGMVMELAVHTVKDETEETEESAIMALRVAAAA